MEQNKNTNKNEAGEGAEPKGDDDSLFQTNWTQQVKEFEDMNLKKDLLRGIFGIGFLKPSIIQQKGIAPLILEKDIIAQAQSGSGKTATFVIGALQRIEEDNKNIQILIMAPTRELAKQIYDVQKDLSQFMNVESHLCTGGTKVIQDKNSLREGKHVVVGTPGRVKDMMERDYLQTHSLKMLIIDEADEMLGLGFLEQINEIIKMIPPECQICLFSATMNVEIINLTKDIMNDPVKILVKNADITLEGIKQYYISCTNDEKKFTNLVEVFGNIQVNQCIIYVNTKDKCDKLAEQMKSQEFTVSSIHGGMEMEQRNEVMKEFRSGASRILISTDLLARGIDVHQVGMVINFELPSNKSNYIHRIGRSGRYGRQGIAINLISNHEAHYLLDIQEYYQTQITELPSDFKQE